MYTLQKLITSTNPAIRIIKTISQKIYHFIDIRLMLIHQDKNKLKFIKQLRNENKVPFLNTEILQIINCVEAVRKLAGDLAEIGVYKGASAKTIAHFKESNRALHLFDTFDKGLPEVVEGHDNNSNLKEGNQGASLKDAKNYLTNYASVYFYKGLFPTTAGQVEDKKFALVHLDVNLYKSTQDSLKFFYPRMVKGGIIISHDYSLLEGVKEAFDEFFNDKFETIIRLPTTQCLIIKQ